MAGASSNVGDSVALTVHGPRGSLDLVVPTAVTVLDVAREYASQAGLADVPPLGTHRGATLEPGASLAGSGVRAGDVLVALTAPTTAPSPSRSRRGSTGPSDAPGALAVVWLALAAATAVLAGLLATRADGTTRDLTVGLLVAAAVVGVMPVGRLAGHRALAAPVFAGAAALAVVWDPEPARLPTVIGLAALVAALTAAVGRSLDQRQEEGLRVWIVVGSLVFVLATGCALVGFEPPVVWSLLLVVAVLAPRFVPAYAVDVPDQLLVDLERLAVSAWSARERPRGRRGRTVVRPSAVETVAEQGARTLTAWSAAVLVLVAVAAPLLLASATLPVDRVGARVLVGLSGAALLLAARSYRHVAARALLRCAGLVCWLVLLVALVGALREGAGTLLAVGSVLLAAVVVLVAVATGRGWRSAWWSRRAEVAEGLVGAGALASVVVAVGIFRVLWESINLPG